jgi:putative aminopeptidase FrvX
MLDYTPLTLLQKLIYARAPSGQEDEVRDISYAYLSELCDHTHIDASGNVIGLVKGQNSDMHTSTRILVHMDEIGMIVKRVNENGQLRVDSLGGLHPVACGQGLVEILGDPEVHNGVLSHGSMHVTRETKSTHNIIPKDCHGNGSSPSWDDVYVVTRKTSEELFNAGIYPGSRVVIAQSRRTIQELGDCIAGYFMDNRAAITIALLAIKNMRDMNVLPLGDVYIVATTQEEIGGFGSSYAMHHLPGDLALAIDVGPVAEEYQTQLNDQPIIVYRDSFSTYDKAVCDRLCAVAKNLNLEPQRAIFGRYGSDASIAKHSGITAKAALICIPTENTHGYEIIHKDGMSNCSKLLAGFLSQET